MQQQNHAWYPWIYFVDSTDHTIYLYQNIREISLQELFRYWMSFVIPLILRLLKDRYDHSLIKGTFRYLVWFLWIFGFQFFVYYWLIYCSEHILLTHILFWTYIIDSYCYEHILLTQILFWTYIIDSYIVLNIYYWLIVFSTYIIDSYIVLNIYYWLIYCFEHILLTHISEQKSKKAFDSIFYGSLSENFILCAVSPFLNCGLFIFLLLAWEKMY